MKRKSLFLISEILLYVSAFIWFFISACNFALSNSMFYLFCALGFLSVCVGLSGSTLKERVKNGEIADKDKKLLIVYACLSIVSPVSTVLYIIILVKNCGAQDEKGEEKAEKPVKEKIKKPWYKRLNFIVSVVAVCTILLSCFSAMCFETSLFSVKVTDFTLTKQMTEKYNSEPLNGVSWVIESDSLSYTVTSYVPKTATADNPAPTIFVMPGFTRTRTTMAQYAVEMSKRGAVVFVIDPGCQGGTTYSGYKENGEMISSTVGANGLNYLVQYVYENTYDYPFVDRERFGAIGHSAGGGNVCDTAEEFAGYNYGDSIIKSLYISGYIKTSSANRYKNLRCNAGLSYAYYDEGEYRYQSDTTSFAVIAYRFVNEVYYSSSNSPLTVPIEEVEYDYGYGNMEDGTYRIIHREKTNHC
ncbi:MAG: hypothetical protein J6Y43_03115, partial [Clostridia bacterium]|nr:hypothetical protein [Clostridia bacterium]